jgi:acetyltransferase
MTIRNLDALFTPKTITLVGASNTPHSVGAVLAKNLIEAGFNGPIMPINPHEQAIHSILNYKSVADLPAKPDLAVLCTPPAAVPELIGQLGAQGCRAAVVITAGFGEGDQVAGKELREAMLKAAQPYLMRIVGPNCLGFISPHAGINASFAQLTPAKGDIAFLTQSGAVATAILDWATARGIGFSHLVSLGDMSDVDFGDLLDFLALDPHTNAILLYVESVTQARKFMSAARLAARAKPVIVIKAGRSDAGAKAALSHTGALAGSDAVYDAAFRRVGMLRVFTLQELFEAAATLATRMKIPGARLAIVTNGGGVGVLATDALSDFGGDLAALNPETIEILDKALPPTWSHGNPIDILGDASGKRYTAALSALAKDKNRDAILVINCPTAVADSLDAAKAVVDATKQLHGVPVLTSWLGEESAVDARRLFTQNRIPTYETPDQAVRAFMHLVRSRRNHELLMQTPASISAAKPDRDAVKEIVREALAEGRNVLSNIESKWVLRAYGIPVVETATARDPAEAAKVAASIGFPVVLKILSPDITHKSDVGGVRLSLANAAAVELAARQMIETVHTHAPEAHIEGFMVEAMVRKPYAQELIAGVANDAAFGPVILFGQGGTSVEVVGDRAIGLPPLNAVLAEELISRTRVAKLLKGYRDHPPCNMEAIEATLIALAQMVSDIDEIVELDINPLLADPDGVIALDARIALKPYEGMPGGRLAIRPYPSELERTLVMNDGMHVAIRPIRPEDEPLLLDMFAKSSREDIRLRFFAPIKEISHAFAARLTQIDYNREMALCALTMPESGPETLLGAVRLIIDPNGESAEFAVFVRSDLKGKGLGYRLMTEILAFAYSRNVGHVFGEVLAENTSMLHVAEALGFTLKRSADDPGVVHVDLPMTKAPARG